MPRDSFGLKFNKTCGKVTPSSAHFYQQETVVLYKVDR